MEYTERRCRVCSKAINSVARFCPTCGAPVLGAELAAKSESAGATSRSPGQDRLFGIAGLVVLVALGMTIYLFRDNVLAGLVVASLGFVAALGLIWMAVKRPKVHRHRDGAV